jgi:hypothetical protein
MGFLTGLRGPDAEFDPYDAFVPDHLPEPGSFLADGRVLSGMDHVACHRLSRRLFAARGVYDVTFGYNLARLNLDHRHPDAGFRYAVERGGPDSSPVLRAEFTPTTEFCPQSEALTVGAFRAWNGASDQHEYARVDVRVAQMHQNAATINRTLRRLEAGYRETGRVPDSRDE